MRGRTTHRGAPRWAPALVALLLPIPAEGQSRGPSWFPDESYFGIAVAGPREPRFSTSLISTDLLGRPRGSPTGPGDGDVRRETQIAVALGGTLRLWKPLEWAGGGAILGIQSGVFGRFRMEGSANALVATDWLVGIPLEVRRGRLSARARFLHWSAHLGDEFIAETGAERQDFTFEAVDLLAARDVGPARVYGGGALVLRSQLEDADDAPPGFSDDGTVRVGADGGWYPWRNGSLGVRLGLDLQWSDRTEWRDQVTGTAMFEARGGERALRAGFSWYDGPSPLGQFFLTQESLWGFEIRIDL